MESHHGDAARSFLTTARNSYKPFPGIAHFSETGNFRAMEKQLFEASMTQLSNDIYQFDGNKFMYAKQYNFLKTDAAKTIARARQVTSLPSEVVAVNDEVFLYVNAWLLKSMAEWFFIRWSTKDEQAEFTQGATLKPFSILIDRYAESPIKMAAGCSSAIAIAVSLFSGVVTFSLLFSAYSVR